MARSTPWQCSEGCDPVADKGQRARHGPSPDQCPCSSNGYGPCLVLRLCHLHPLMPVVTYAGRLYRVIPPQKLRLGRSDRRPCDLLLAYERSRNKCRLSVKKAVEASADKVSPGVRYRCSRCWAEIHCVIQTKAGPGSGYLKQRVPRRLPSILHRRPGLQAQRRHLVMGRRRAWSVGGRLIRSKSANAGTCILLRASPSPSCMGVSTGHNVVCLSCQALLRPHHD